MYFCKKQKTFRILTTALTVLIIVFIFTQSLMPGKVSGDESSMVVVFLNSITTFLGIGEPFTQEFVRTCAHFTEFSVLGMAMYSMHHSYFTKLSKSIIFTTISFILIAVFDECLQLFSEGRAFQISDILIDVCGAFFGSLLILLLVLNKKNKA